MVTTKRQVKTKSLQGLDPIPRNGVDSTKENPKPEKKESMLEGIMAVLRVFSGADFTLFSLYIFFSMCYAAVSNQAAMQRNFKAAELLTFFAGIDISNTTSFLEFFKSEKSTPFVNNLLHVFGIYMCFVIWIEIKYWIGQKLERKVDMYVEMKGYEKLAELDLETLSQNIWTREMPPSTSTYDFKTILDLVILPYTLCLLVYELYYFSTFYFVILVVVWKFTVSVVQEKSEHNDDEFKGISIFKERDNFEVYHKEDILIYGLKDYLLDRLYAAKLRVFQRSMARRRIERIKTLFDTIDSAFEHILLFYAIYHALLGTGQVSKYQGIRFVFHGLSDVATRWRDMKSSAKTSSEKFQKFQRLLALKPLITRPVDPVDIPLQHGLVSRRKTTAVWGLEIEFRNVYFRYPKTNKDVVSNLSVTFKSGEHIALLGVNGAGKSTFIKLLCRMYLPTSGEIFVNGIEMSLMDPEEYWKMLAVVFQDYRLFNMTAGENIGIGNLEYIHEPNRVLDAAQKTGADRFITKLEKGFDHELLEGMISGGQKQKLAAARAFIRSTSASREDQPSRLIILDEPSAALDSHSEVEILGQFNRLMQGTPERDSQKGIKSYRPTTIFVTHRLAAVKSLTERIIVIENGTIAEDGTHNELMALKRLYYGLYTVQASGYVDNVNLE